MGKKSRTFMILLIALLGGIQFIRPSMTNPPEDPTKTLRAAIETPSEIQAIFDRACADCHSDRTRWPWYAYVAPVSWFVAHDVEEGRRHMNWSRWAEYGAYRQQEKLDELCDEIREGEMPLGKYTLVHGEAKLGPEEIDLICRWATAQRDRVRKTLDASDILRSGPDGN